MSKVLESYGRSLSSESEVDLEKLARDNGIDVAAPAKTMVLPNAQKELMQAAQPMAPSDVGGVVGSVAVGAAKGVGAIGVGLWNSGVDVADGIENFAAKNGMGSGTLIDESSKIQADSLTPRNTTEAVSKAIIQYGAPIAGLIATGLGPVAATAAGAGIDFSIMDPEGERMSSMVLEHAPEARNLFAIGATLDYLKNKEDESSLEGRFKNMVEGLLVGGVVTAGFKGLGSSLRGAQKVSKYARDFKNAEKPMQIGAEAVVQEAQAVKKAVTETATQDTRVVTQGAKEVAVEDSAQMSLFDQVHIKTDAEGKYIPNLLNGDIPGFMTEFAKAHPQEATARVAREGGLDEALQGWFKNPENVTNLMKWKAGDRPLSEIEVKASQYMLNNSGAAVVDMAEKAIVANTPEEWSAFAETLQGFQYLDNVRTGAGSEAGAALNAHKITTDFAEIPLSEYYKKLTEDGQRKLISDLNKMAGGEKNLEDMARNIQKINSMGPDEARKALQLAAQDSKGSFRKMQDALAYAASNAMVSSPKTMVANFASNALTTVNSMVTSYGAALNPTAEYSLRQANSYFTGTMSALFDNLIHLNKVMSGEVAAATIKKDYKAMINPIQQLADDGSWTLTKQLVNGTGWVVEKMGKGSSFGDAFFGTAMYRGKLKETAITLAEKKGLAGQEAEDFINKFVKDPFINDHKAAVEFSQEGTFSKALDPESLAGRFDTIVGDNIPFGRVIFPFLKTTANIVEYSYNHSPFKGLAYAVSPTLRAELKGEGVTAELARQKIYNGTAFLGVMTYLAANDHFTGPEPENFKVKRALEESRVGWQADSLKIGDTYISMQRIEPINSVMRLASVMSQAKNYMNEEEYQQFAVVAGGAMADFFTPEQLVDSTAGFLNVIREAQSVGPGQAAKNFGTSLVTRFVPTVVKDVRQSIDPYRGDTTASKDGFQSVVDKISRSISNKVPYLSESLPIQRNIFGEPILVPATLPNSMGFSTEDSFKTAAGEVVNFLSPFYSSKGDNSDLNTSLRKVAQYYTEMYPTNPDLPPLNIAMPSRVFSDGLVKLEMTPTEYEKYLLYMNGMDKDGKKVGLGLRDLVGEKMRMVKQVVTDIPLTDKQYKQVVGELSEAFVKGKKLADAQMQNDPDFSERLNNARLMELDKEPKPINIFERK